MVGIRPEQPQGERLPESTSELTELESVEVGKSARPGSGGVEEGTVATRGANVNTGEDHLRSIDGGGLLVGVDGSDGSLLALDWAAMLARHLDVGVDLIHALSPWVGLEMALPPLDYDQYRDAVGLSVAGWELKLDGVQHTTRVIEDDAAGGILMVASETHPGLIILGAHGTGRWTKHLLGSVTNKILHSAENPVAVVPLSTELNRVGGRVIVGVDGSPSSLRAVRWAATWAKSLGMSVYAVCVLPIDVYGEKPRLADPESLDFDGDTLMALRSLAVQVSRETGAVIASDALIGHPAHELLNVARDEFALVVGATGHSTFAELTLGSTSHTCAAHSQVPVAVVP